MASDFQITFHREASEELERAKAWYEQQRAGLGEAFLHEVESAISRIRDNPTTWPCVSGERYAAIYSSPVSVWNRLPASIADHSRFSGDASQARTRLLEEASI